MFEVSSNKGKARYYAELINNEPEEILDEEENNGEKTGLISRVTIATPILVYANKECNQVVEGYFRNKFVYTIFRDLIIQDLQNW